MVSTRPLGIPTLADRAVQAVVKNALEPEWEARFEATSYGFRPGRSAHDAIEKVFHLTHSGSTKLWVVDADIKGCFDNIDHGPLLRSLGTFPASREIRAWLKAGYMESGVLHSTDSGTPQGGVISPLLANVALHGLDEALGIRRLLRRDGHARIIGNRAWVRYADDFVVFCETKKDAERVVDILQTWMAERGLSLAKDKTRIVHMNEGFDFLGFNVRRYPAWRTSRTELVHADNAEPQVGETCQGEAQSDLVRCEAPAAARHNPEAQHRRAGMGQLLPWIKLLQSVQRSRPLDVRQSDAMRGKKARQQVEGVGRRPLLRRVWWISMGVP